MKSIVEYIILLKMVYKEKCGWRKNGFCKFKPQQCCQKKDGIELLDYCELYDIEYDIKTIKKKIKSERKDIIKLDKEMKQLKKTDEHKDKSKKRNKKIKLLIVDKSRGIKIMSDAYIKLKRIG